MSTIEGFHSNKDIASYNRVVVAILDAFHFDLTGARPLDEGEAGGSEHRGLLTDGGTSTEEGAGQFLSATDAVGTTETQEGEQLPGVY